MSANRNAFSFPPKKNKSEPSMPLHKSSAEQDTQRLLRYLIVLNVLVLAVLVAILIVAILQLST